MKKLFSLFFTILFFLLPCFSSCSNDTAIEIGKKLTDAGYNVYHADCYDVADFLEESFNLRYQRYHSSDFSRGVFAWHELVNGYCAYVIFCESREIAEQLESDIEQNMFIFSDIYEIRKSELTCVRQLNVIYVGHKDTVKLARK